MVQDARDAALGPELGVRHVGVQCKRRDGSSDVVETGRTAAEAKRNVNADPVRLVIVSGHVDPGVDLRYRPWRAAGPSRPATIRRSFVSRILASSGAAVLVILPRRLGWLRAADEIFLVKRHARAGGVLSDPLLASYPGHCRYLIRLPGSAPPHFDALDATMRPGAKTVCQTPRS